MGADRLLEGLKRNGSMFLVQIKPARLVIRGAGLHVVAVVCAVPGILNA